MSLPTPAARGRSLLRKFRYATLFQALLMIGLAVGAIWPALSRLDERATERRERAKTEIIDSEINNVARLTAMELGRYFLPELWKAADAQRDLKPAAAAAEIQAVEERLARLTQQITERVAEKISYNGILVDVVLLVATEDPRGAEGRAFVFPEVNPRLPPFTLEQVTQLKRYKRLVKLRADETYQLGSSAIVDYLLRRGDELGAQPYLLPIRREGFPYGYVGMVVNTELISEQFAGAWSEFWDELSRTLLWFGALALLALVGGAVFINVLAARFIRPLEAMRAALDAVRHDGAGGIETSELLDANLRLAAVAADPRDEVGELRSSFMRLAGKLAETLHQKAEALARLRDSLQELRRADRLKLVGTLTYGLAHNLNNALAPIANVAHSAALKSPHDERLRKMMDMILDGVDRCAKIVARLRDLTRLNKGETVAVQINRILDETIEAAGRVMPNQSQRTIDVVQEFSPLPEIQGNPVELWELFTNLLVNAREALARMPAEHVGKIIVRTSLVDSAVAVEVNDNGPGMPPEVRDKAFEAWFSTKAGGEASGIGLWISQRIVSEHGGQMTIDTAEGHGTTVRVVLHGMSATKDA